MTQSLLRERLQKVAFPVRIVCASDSAFMNANMSTSFVAWSTVMQGISPSGPNFGCRSVPSSTSAVVVGGERAAWLMGGCHGGGEVAQFSQVVEV